MNPINEKVKSCTEEIYKKLEGLNCKRRHSPDSSNDKKPKLARSKWAPAMTQLPEDSPTTCTCCESLKSIISNLRDHTVDLQSALNRLSDENTLLKQSLHQSEELRKILHTQLQSFKGPLRVCCRVKPTLNKFIEYPDSDLTSKPQAITILNAASKNSYVFDRIFTEASTQIDIFSELEPYIQSAVDGGKVCIFSYGQTGSGKTYTLEGDNFHGDLTFGSGVLPRACVKIYSEISRQNLASLQVFISCIEVYMDNISDLLQDVKGTKKTPSESQGWKRADSIEEILEIISEAAQRRITRGTHQNSASSRSHTIYQIRIEGIGINAKDIKGRLSVIDLAGSERANMETFTDKSAEEVESMKKIHEEAKYINKSLSCLKRVFESLSNESGLMPPYRETKLTRVLQEQIQSGTVVLIVTISPDNYRETKESLKFGSTVQLARKVNS